MPTLYCQDVTVVTRNTSSSNSPLPTNHKIAKISKMDIQALMASMGGGEEQLKLKEQKPWSDLRFKEKVQRTVQNTATQLNSYKWLPYLFFPFVLSMGFHALNEDQPNEMGEIPTFFQKTMHVVMTLIPIPLR